jgi:hypothetical protein
LTDKFFLALFTKKKWKYDTFRREANKRKKNRKSNFVQKRKTNRTYNYIYINDSSASHHNNNNSVFWGCLPAAHDFKKPNKKIPWKYQKAYLMVCEENSILQRFLFVDRNCHMTHFQVCLIQVRTDPSHWSQYIVAGLNMKSCSGLKTTTACEGIPFSFKITINCRKHFELLHK